MNILIATHNISKFLRYKNTLSDFKDMQFSSLSDVSIVEKSKEPYKTVKENAIYKAHFYGNISQVPTLAIDESVETNFLPDNEQPGVFVRRFATKNEEMTDSETLEIWKQIFEKYKHIDKQFIWDYSIAYYKPEDNYEKYTSVTAIASVANEFSKKVIPGYPMSSFMIYKGTNKPHASLTDEERVNVDKQLLSPFIVEFIQWISNH